MSRPARPRAASRVALAVVAVAAGGAGYGAGRDGGAVPVALTRAWAEFASAPPAAVEPAAATGPVVYYRDPDGKPVYSLSPMPTEDGRLFRAVRASEDVRFDRPEPGEAAGPATGTGDAAAGSVGSAPARSGADRVVRYYRNPMGLPDTSPVPKKDPMGMDYIPVYGGDDPDPETVALSPGRIQRTGVRSAPAEDRVVSRPVRVPGTVALDERRVTVVATRADAYVDHVEDVTTGDRVRKGQPLVAVYAPEINAAAAQLIANPGFDGARRRIRNLNVSEDVIAEMERTRTVPRAITWASPRDGLVLERRAVEGMKAAAGDTLFRIADLSRVWVLADVPEHDLAEVRVGQAATIRVPGRTIPGRVGSIYPQVNRETRTTRIRIEVPNPDGQLLPDMYAEVAILTGSTEPVVAVPEAAVLETGSRPVVLIDAGEGRFAPRPVELGRRGDGYVEIRAGLRAGERVVTAANFLIDAESNLKSALASLAAPEPGPAWEPTPALEPAR